MKVIVKHGVRVEPQYSKTRGPGFVFYQQNLSDTFPSVILAYKSTGTGRSLWE